MSEIKEKGIYYSQLWDIVKSDNWANLKEEQGDGGANAHSLESNKKRSDTLKGRTITADHRRKLSEANKGRYFHSEETKKLASQKASIKLKELTMSTFVNFGISELSRIIFFSWLSMFVLIFITTFCSSFFR